MNFSDLCGETLIEHDESGRESGNITTDRLNGKTVALYFSAHWCPPCRRFTPILAALFKGLDNEVKNKFDILFVSCDEDQESFDKYFKEMPWKALPFSDRERSQTLGEKLEVSGIPALIVLSPTCEQITNVGVEEVRAGSQKAIAQWTQGKSLFWSREARENEHSWSDVTCSNCYMRPMIGVRHGCLESGCDLDLCEACLPNVKHEHNLVEYLAPKKAYPMEKLFSVVPHLLDPKSGEKIDTKTLWQSDVKSVGFYFSAHWCPPCRAFTPELAELYKQLQASPNGFRMVFISCDRDEDSFNEYRAEMPWPAVPLNSGAILKEYFQFSGIPALFILSVNGELLSRRGRGDVSGRGIEALQTWGRGEKLAPLPPESFVWGSVTCDGCKACPLVGKRYFCETCGNYDLCSACEQKGHEHPLQLIPPPADDDDD